jgi:hypothetical protein
MKAVVSINEEDIDDVPNNQSVSTNGPAGLYNMDWDNRFSDASIFVSDYDDDYQ